MLLSLVIQNFVIVKHLELDFANGMTVFTGETGAGKSIMIDALMLVLGSRGDANLIRMGEEKCDITAIFNYHKNSEPALWLATHEFLGDEHTIILRRVIYRLGSSKTFINGHQVPLQKLKELTRMLVHIHGQHQHQNLMHHSVHRKQLDEYAAISELSAQVHILYKACEELKQQISVCQNQDLANRIKLLQFQIAELSALELKKDEPQNLHQEHQFLHNACSYLTQTEQLINLLDGDHKNSICCSLNQCLQLSNSLPKENQLIQNTILLFKNALIQCKEAFAELQNFAGHVEVNPKRLQEIESRLSTLHHTARKYHVEISQLAYHLENLEKELQDLENTTTTIANLQKKYETKLQEFDNKSLELSKLRKLYAPKLGTAITTKMQSLGMQNGWLEVEVVTSLAKRTPYGIDQVEYKVCTNLGTVPAPLTQIASGGELSRISLAIQIITAQKGATPTLIFDEVDVGIGGATAAIVGQLLRNLGERLQVFCITHQPQVAACSHHHFCVEKYTEDEQTYSKIVSLNQKQKITEIARMLGGLTITSQTLLHAEELLQQNSCTT